ncbi:MAG: hypothetical protein ACO2ZK_11275, partial [Gemmobacter sp.]
MPTSTPSEGGSGARRLQRGDHRAGLIDKAIKLNQSLLAKYPQDVILLNNLAGLYQKAGVKR